MRQTSTPSSTSVAPPSTQQAAIIHPWNPDRGDGTYANPVICADYSDPDVTRDGDDFYLVASSFNCTPGLPILHSRDLVNWTIVAHALKNNPDPRNVFHLPRHGEGVWAPAIRKHDGLFYIFFPMPDEGIYVITAKDPKGKWSEPRLLLEGKGLIDPCPLWDDDGKAYLVHAYAKSRAGIKDKLHVREMSRDATSIIADGQIVFDDEKNHPTLEGPKFHKRNGYYYLSAPAGGVATGWQVILRSRDIYGPYEAKTVLAQGRTPINGPHQGAIVDTPGGEWWFVHFQDVDLYGRIVHLQPVRWEDDWPLMGINQNAEGVGEPVMTYRKPTVTKAAEFAVPQTTDNFAGREVSLAWQWHANHHDNWHKLDAASQTLRLNAIATADDFAQTPNLLLQKFPARVFSVETMVQLSDPATGVQAGLIVMGTKHAAVVVTHDAGRPHAHLIIDNRVVDARLLSGARAALRVQVTEGGKCVFLVADVGDELKRIGPEFQATVGRWIGAKVGIFARTPGKADAGGSADFGKVTFGS